MKKCLRQMLRLFIILGMPLIIGCSGLSRSSTVEVKELGLSLDLPPGWKSERGNLRMMVDSSDPENRFGLIEDYPAEGKSLNQHVAEMTSMDAASIRSRQSRTIGGCPAVELVSEAQFALIEVIIHKGDRIIRVSFRVEKEVFPAQRPALQKSLASILFQ